MSSSSAISFSDAASPESMSTSSPVNKASNELRAPVPTAESGTSSSVASSTVAPVTFPASRICFYTSEDILLLREVTVHEQPFVRGSPAREEVAANLSDDCKHLQGITACTARERILTLIKSYIADDNKLTRLPVLQ